MRVLLLTPPMLQLNSPYPATPFLTAFLRREGYEAVQDDLSIRLALRLFSRAGLRELAGTARHAPPSPAVAHFLRHLDACVETVEPAVALLQGADTSAARRIVRRDFLPEGPRFAVLRELGQAFGDRRGERDGGALDEIFGTKGILDRACYLASLFLDDLADAIREGADPRFGFARYGEQLAASAPRFDPLLDALRGQPSMVDRLLDQLTEETLRRNRPAVVGVTAPFPGNVYGAFRIAQTIRRLAPRVKTVLGGGYVNTELRELRDPRVFDFFDFVTLDDGELPLLRILEHRRRPAPERLVRTFRRTRGEVRFHAGPAAMDPHHDTRPAPCYDGLPPGSYISLREMPNPMYTLWSDTAWNKLMLAHGCYWRRCAFCDTTLDYICRYEPARVGTLLAWIEQSIAQTGRRAFHFVDEAAPPALLRQLAGALLERGLGITWWTNIRFESAFTPELAALLARSGCVALSGGIETCSDRSLRLMDKGVSLQQAAAAGHALAGAGIMVHAYLMYGFPGQTSLETVNALEYVRQMFAAGALQSAFWHRFALTVHSRIHGAPDAFGIALPSAERGDFARNESPFADAARCDHAMLGTGLRAALYNYMHGIGLQEDVRAWFPQPVPKPTLPRRFVKNVLSPSKG